MDVFKEVVCRDGQNDKNISQLSKFLRYVSEYTYLLTIFYLHLKKIFDTSTKMDLFAFLILKHF